MAAIIETNSSNTKSEQLNEIDSGVGTNLPLKGKKNISLKLYGILALIGLIVLFNHFVLPKSKDKQNHGAHQTTEDFNLDTMNPSQHMNQFKEANQNPQIKLNQNNIEHEIEALKAKDFIKRLSAGQALGSSSPSLQNSSLSSTNISPRSSSHASFDSSTGLNSSIDPNTAFLESQEKKQAKRSYAERIGAEPYLIGQGKFIFATLTVAVNSDLPGQISAIVSQNIYGEKGRNVLIPRGTRLIGQYKSGLANNQSRLFVVWDRLILSNGISVMLGSEGTDALGQAGLTGKTNYHFFARFGTATLLSLIGTGVSTIGVNPQDEYNSLAAYRQAASQALAKEARDTLSSTANIPPTVHVKQGSRVVVFVNKDLDFSKVYR